MSAISREMQCPCGCHKTLSADMRAAGQIGDFWLRFELAQKDKDAVTNEPPDTGDPIAAASACPSCVNAHCEALVTRRAPVEKAEWIEPPRNTDTVGDDGA